MARDLIPPPSPAGRPERESSEKLERERGLWSGGEDDAAAPPAGLAAALEETEAPAADTPTGPSPYRSRFGFVLGGLIGVAIAAVGLGLILAFGSSGASTAPDGWSSWRPTAGDDKSAARQIAEHVGPQYRLGDGDQLVAVQASGLEIANLPLSVAMRTSATGGDIRLIDGHGVMFTLNGLGPHGSITKGQPSVERHLLLRREALELALYTFRYAKGVDMVVALLPPKPPAKGADPAAAPPPTQALFYRPGDLKGELGVPLMATIGASTPRPETLKPSGPEGLKIDALTRSNLFLAAFQQGQDAHAYLVLSRAG
jgi:hypothetical protein